MKKIDTLIIFIIKHFKEHIKYTFFPLIKGTKTEMKDCPSHAEHLTRTPWRHPELRATPAEGAAGVVTRRELVLKSQGS